MIVEKIVFINRAPFEHLEVNFLNEGVNILTAINGKGKTTIISHIVDALYEMTRPVYANSYEGIENKYYRVSSSIFNLNSAKFSLVYIRFKENEEIIDYIDCRGPILEEEYKTFLPYTLIPFDKINNKLEKSNCIKIFSSNCKKNLVESIFENQVITYFPAYRFEKPSFLNDPYKKNIHLNQEEKWGGCLTNPIEVITGIKQFAEWILDLVLDGEVYTRIQKFQLNNGETQNIDITPEKITLAYANNLITNILSSKRLGNLRFAISKRNNTGQRVTIVNKDGSKSIAPNLFSLSSGEAALLCIFGEILRQADNLKINPDPQKIKGLVLIDEIEKHLHITLQKEILPILFKLFPNIQFIISSHSPFLNMGLAEHQPNRSLLIDLDNNGLSISPEENSQYKEVYNMMISDNQRFADQLRTLSATTKASQRPVIVTEGKTDWKHLKSALSVFKENGEFSNLDIEFFEYDFDFGDAKLHKLLEQYKLIHHRYPIIGVFDCDEDNGKKIHNEGGLRKYNDTVWGLSIDIPEFRKYNSSGISIEFLYQDGDLKKEDENHRRLFISSEFNENGRLVSNLQIGVKNIHDVKKYLDKSQEKVQCDEVIDINGNSLALSKEQFASNILNKVVPFDKMDFNSFRPIFEKIQNIINKS